MKFTRRFTTSSPTDPYAGLEFAPRSVTIHKSCGTVTKTIAVPSGWSDTAAQMIVDKYARREGVPDVVVAVPDDDATMPAWLWRRVPAAGATLGGETDGRQVFDRLAGCWTHWGWKARMFDTEEDARVFHNEIRYMLARQMAAPNSPQYFNTGLNFAYGIDAPARNQFYFDPTLGRAVESGSAYQRPVSSACYISGVDDSLNEAGGIMDLWCREALIFKFGSGSGVNVSNIRGYGEPLSGGGRSSGLLSFLKVGDRSAGAIKSGGITRRAAKLIVLDLDHPDIEEFINWKVAEEDKVAFLVAGSARVRAHAAAMARAAEKGGGDRRANLALRSAAAAARADGVPAPMVERVLSCLESGRAVVLDEMTAAWEGEAYQTVSGQNANNSVSVTNRFMALLDAPDGQDVWPLYGRVERRRAAAEGREPVPCRTVSARKLWGDVVHAAWASADPGIILRDTVNEWHTCPAEGPIDACNPCSEYHFLNDTACNLASVNLLAFYDRDSGMVRVDDLMHAARLWTAVLEISVVMSQYPAASVAENTYRTRTLGLGYANLGALLMVHGVPYDSARGRNVAAALTAVVHCTAYATSAEMAREFGPFPAFARNREAMLRVVRNHRAACYPIDEAPTEGLAVQPTRLHPAALGPDAYLADAARLIADHMVRMGEAHGFRNAQTTVIAPTGTISLLMDCDTTGVEPDFALVKFKTLAGGGGLKIVNRAVPAALARLGYSPEQVADVGRYVLGRGTIEGCPHYETLTAGMEPDEVIAADEAARVAIDLRTVFPEANVNKLTPTQRGEAADWVVGRMTVEGAPHVDPGHYAVFDCANRCGRTGTRSIAPEGHVLMVAACQPFVSGSLSKCVTGDTVVATSDGLRRIGTLYRGEAADSYRRLEGLSVPKPGGMTPAAAFYFGGVKKVWSVTLSDGRKVRGTSPHRLRVAGADGLGWKTMPEIQEGDFVALHRGTECWGRPTVPDVTLSPHYGSQNAFIKPSPEFAVQVAEFLGMLTADGHVTRSNYVVGLTKNEEAVLSRFNYLLGELFGLSGRLLVDQRNGVRSVQVGSKSLVEWLDGVGFSKEAVPDFVLGGTREMALAYLSGLYLDGYVSKQGHVAVSQKHRSLLDDVQRFWDNLGIATYFADNVINGVNYQVLHVSGHDRVRAAKMLKWYEAHKTAAAERLEVGQDRRLFPMYRQRIQDEARRQHMTQGTRSVFDPRTLVLRRDTALAAMRTLGLSVSEDEICFDYVQVVAVEECDPEPVYDLSVPETEAFVGNGIVNHNTINLPDDATVEDFDRVYRLGHRSMCKAVSAYRDAAKMSQPLTSAGADAPPESAVDAVVAVAAAAAGRAVRRRLPDRRAGYTQKARIGRQKMYIRTGEYEDGALGEIFLDMHKEGAAFRSITSAFAIAISLGLQHGVPLEEFVDAFVGFKFEPNGIVQGNPHVKSVTSVLDYVFRELAVTYLGMHELADTPPAGEADRPRSAHAGPPPPHVLAARGGLTAREAAALMGYEGDPCPECGHLKLVKSGRCKKCDYCGATSGCS